MINLTRYKKTPVRLIDGFSRWVALELSRPGLHWQVGAQARPAGELPHMADLSQAVAVHKVTFLELFSTQCCNLTPNSVLIRYFVPLVAERLYQRAQLLQIMLHMYPASLKARLARDSAPIHQLQRVFRSHQRQLCERVIEAVSAARVLSCGVCRRVR